MTTMDGFSPVSSSASVCATIGRRSLSAAVALDELVAAIPQAAVLANRLRELSRAAGDLGDALQRASTLSEALRVALSRALDVSAQAVAVVEKRANTTDPEATDPSSSVAVFQDYDLWAVLATNAFQLLRGVVQTPKHSKQEDMLRGSNVQQALEGVYHTSQSVCRSASHLVTSTSEDGNDALPTYEDSATPTSPGYPRDVKDPSLFHQSPPSDAGGGGPPAYAESSRSSSKLASLSEAFRAMTAPFRYKPEPLVAALCEAAARGNAHHVATLVASGANIAGRDEKGKTPLVRAIEAHQYASAERLLDLGAPTGVADSAQKLPALFWATRVGDIRIAELLLQRGCSPRDKNIHGTPYFCETVGEGNVAMVRLLLDHGADVRAKDVSGREVMWHAYKKAGLDMIELLHARGGNVNAKDVSGTPIINLALQEGKLDVFKFLLDHGANPNSTSCGGTALLVEAERQNRLDLVKLLLQRGAEANVRDTSGTPLLVTVLKSTTYTPAEKIDLARTLLTRGAKPTGSDSSGRNPLTLAVEQRLTELIPVLLERGADPNYKIRATGETLLLHAIGLEPARRAVLVPTLLRGGADPNAADARGRTPLVQALRARDFATVALLLERGADANKEGAIAPVDLARVMGEVDVVSLLRRFGARADEEGGDGSQRGSGGGPLFPESTGSSAVGRGSGVASPVGGGMDVAYEPPPDYNAAARGL